MRVKTTYAELSVDSPLQEMNVIRKLLAGSIAAAAMLAIVPGAAGAADTDVTFTVSAGALSIAEGGAKDLGSVAPGSVLSGSLNSVTVSDQRGGASLNPWTVYVKSDAGFSEDGGDTTISGASASAYMSTTDIGGDAVDKIGQTLSVGDLTVGQMAYTYVATSAAKASLDPSLNSTNGGRLLEGDTLGTGSLTFTPTLDVPVPGDAGLGGYSGTVTYTVVGS